MLMLITHIGAPQLLMLEVLFSLTSLIPPISSALIQVSPPFALLLVCLATLTLLFVPLPLPHFFLGIHIMILFNSDHFPILLDSSFSYPCTSSIPKWNLSAADWDRFRSDLHLPTQFESPDQSCQSTSDALLSAATHSVPLSTPRPRVAFWWTRACTETRKKKNVALTRYQHHRGDVSA